VHKCYNYYFWLIWPQSVRIELLWQSFVHRPSVRQCVSASVPECVNFFIQTTSPLKPLIGFLPNFTGRIPRGSPTKFVQTISIGCISRSHSQKVGFQNAIFKNSIVLNYKVQSFHIFYIAPSRGPPSKLFKLYPRC